MSSSRIFLSKGWPIRRRMSATMSQGMLPDFWLSKASKALRSTASCSGGSSSIFSRKNKKSAKRSSTSEVEKAAKESDAKPQVEGTQLAKTTTLDDDDSKSTQDSTSVVRALDSLVNNELASDLARKIQMLQASTSAAKDLTDAKQHNYEFWKTQPVPSFDEKATENTYIHPPLEVDQVRKDPYSLPEPFAWADVDVNSNAELDELYTLLTENYVEDDDNMFRFDYSREFLRWALMSPGWQKTWHCGIRAGNSSGKLLAFIAAVPAVIRIYDKTVRMVEINFLCVHKKLRSKRVAPVLIREITRRVNLHEIFQATFTAGIVIPKPVGMCRYWHRSLNPKKLVETSFSHLSRNMTMQRTIKLHKLPDQPQLFGIRTLEKRHVSTAYKLLNNYLAKFDMAPDFREDEFEHFFVPRDNVVYSYVIEDKSGKVTDLLSFYCLPSSVMHHPLHKSIKAAYSFYNVATSTSIIQLMNDALIIAKNEGFDVFNALDLMDNKDFLEKLKFGIGDGNLQYYLYNWKCPDLTPERIGLVLQ